MIREGQKGNAGNEQEKYQDNKNLTTAACKVQKSTGKNSQNTKKRVQPRLHAENKYAIIKMMRENEK